MQHRQSSRLSGLHDGRRRSLRAHLQRAQASGIASATWRRHLQHPLPSRVPGADGREQSALSAHLHRAGPSAVGLQRAKASGLPGPRRRDRHQFASAVQHPRPSAIALQSAPSSRLPAIGRRLSGRALLQRAHSSVDQQAETLPAGQRVPSSGKTPRFPRCWTPGSAQETGRSYGHL